MSNPKSPGNILTVSCAVPAPREILDYWLTQDGKHPAFVTRNLPLSHADLNERVRNAEGTLVNQGFSKNSILALAFPNSIDFVVWLLAAFRMGASVLPVNPRSSAPELLSALNRSGARFLASTEGFSAPEKSEWIQILSKGVTTSLWCLPIDQNDASRNKDPSSLIHQFTSGSTGMPRLLIRNERQVLEDYAHFMRALEIKASDRFLLIPPIYHAFGMLGLFAGLASGATTYSIDRFLPAEVLRMASSFQPTVVFATPVMVEMLGACFLSAGDAAAFKSVRHFICSTDRLKKSVRDLFFERFGMPVRVQYGSTETLSATIDLTDNYIEGKVGRPYPGVAVRIFDDHGEALNASATGRVGIKSPAAAESYADELSPKLEIIDGYVIPGDRGYLDTSGDLYIVGRDGIYNIGGWKVDPLEISAVISAALDVSHVAVLPFTRAGQSAIRVVIESRDFSLQPDDVISLCRKSLSAYKVPAKVEIYASLNRDENGKVRLSDLPSDRP